MSQFLHDDNDNTKAIAVPWVFSENSLTCFPCSVFKNKKNVVLKSPSCSDQPYNG